MSGRFSRRAAAVIGCAALLAPAAGAQASNTALRLTVKHGVPQIIRSQAKILNGVARYEQTHSLAPLIKAINAEDRTLTGLELKVGGEAPSSTAGRKAKSDVVTGLRLIVASNATLVAQLQNKAAGRPVSRSQVQRAVAAAFKGNKDLAAGGRLLKI